MRHETQKTYLLLTLGPGTHEEPNGWIIVVEYPGFRIVDKISRDNGVFQSTHKGICGASLSPEHPNADFVGTTEAEVFLGKLAPLKICDGVTHKCFNDLHHAAFDNGEIAVANAGCDSIEILSVELSHERTIPLIPLFKPSFGYCISLTAEEIKRNFRRLRGEGASYRHLTHKRKFANVRKLFSPSWTHRPKADMRFQDMRPHFLHPNHVQFNDGEWAVTLFRAGQQIGLSTGRILATGLARPHDGVFESDHVIFTESSTSVISVRTSGGDKSAVRTMEIIPAKKKGFLRGVTRRKNQLFAGLTARRGTSVTYARVAVVKFDDGTIEETWTIPKKFGSQVYSVIDVTSYYQD